MPLISGLPSLPEGFAGVDEAGRGCLAGPVVAAAVILPPRHGLAGLDDSKALCAEARQDLAPRIRATALAWGLGLSWPREIDRVNILQATFAAMARAVAALRIAPASLAVDGPHPIPGHVLRRILKPGLRDLAQQPVVDGDALVPAISAASVLAKTFRDALMERLDLRYPGYGLALHKGYGTAEHRAAVLRLGPCRLHRMTFRGVRPEPPAQEQGRLC
ncbi:MAG: ribonuclease HII [Thermodesulfobacteriota bacterium]